MTHTCTHRYTIHIQSAAPPPPHLELARDGGGATLHLARLRYVHHAVGARRFEFVLKKDPNGFETTVSDTYIIKIVDKHKRAFFSTRGCQQPDVLFDPHRLTATNNASAV